MGAKVSNPVVAEFKDLYRATSDDIFWIAADIVTRHPDISLDTAYEVNSLLSEMAVYDDEPRSHYRDNIEDRLEQFRASGFVEVVNDNVIQNPLRKTDSAFIADMKATLKHHISLDRYIYGHDYSSKERGKKTGRWWNYPITEGVVTVRELAVAFEMEEAEVRGVLKGYGIKPKK